MKRVLFGALMAVACATAQEWNVGSKVTDFTVADLAGKPAGWTDLKGGTTVILFIATKCPISNGYNERMNALYKEYTPKGVKFVVINANATEPAKDVGEHARQNNFAFTVYKDAGNVVADRFNAQVTPEAFVIDSGGVIRYHGYIDDSPNPARIQKHGLRTALDAVLAGKPVETAQTKAFGCTIKRAKR